MAQNVRFYPKSLFPVQPLDCIWPPEITAVIPVVDSLHTHYDSTEGAAYQLPGKGDKFVAPYRQFPTAIRPFTLRWEICDPANSQLAPKPGTTPT